MEILNVHEASTVIASRIVEEIQLSLGLLIYLSFVGHNELMRLLIYSGFNPRQKDNYGQTPLHLACINGNLTAVKELCEQVDLR